MILRIGGFEMKKRGSFAQMICLSLIAGVSMLGMNIYGETNWTEQGKVITASQAQKIVEEQKYNEKVQSQKWEEEETKAYLEDQSGYIYPNSDMEKIEGYALNGNLVMTRIGKYEIYARHGSIISDANCAKYFENKTWYRKDKEISQVQLNDTEQYNVALLNWWENVLSEGKNQMQVQDTAQRLYCDSVVYKANRPFKLDLNGDGKAEQIKYFCKSLDDESDYNKMTLMIDGKKVRTAEGFFAPQIWSVDINPKDSYKELVIYDMGPSSDPVDYFFTYNQGKGIFMGAVEGHINDSWARNYISDGILHALERNDDAGTDRYNCNYILNAQHKLQKVNTPYYEMHKPAFLNTSIMVYEKQDLSSQGQICQEATGVIILAIDHTGWYKLQLPSGEIGWAYKIRESLSGLLYYD